MYFSSEFQEKSSKICGIVRVLYNLHVSALLLTRSQPPVANIRNPWIQCLDKSYQRKQYNTVFYHNNKGTTERYKFLDLGWSRMEMCEQAVGDHTGQARVLLFGVQQEHRRKKGMRQREGCRCTHPCTAVLLFSFLARTLHSFHSWKDIALEIIWIFQFIYNTRLKTNDGGKHVLMDESPLESFQKDPLLSQLQTPISWRL